MHGWRAVVKRIFDFCFSLVLLVVLFPLFLLIAVLVKLSSAGPVLYQQERVGKDGKLFQLYKFRSMRVNASSLAVTAGNDPRITTVGKWLRKSKLDELPQFINVLVGQMSLVGPRPEVPKYVEHYTDEQKRVLSVRPGVTGRTQVLFRDEQTLLAGADDVEAFYLSEVMPQKLAIDLVYVDSASLLNDLSLIGQTALLVIGIEPKGKRGQPA